MNQLPRWDLLVCVEAAKQHKTVSSAEAASKADGASKAEAASQSEAFPNVDVPSQDEEASQ